MTAYDFSRYFDKIIEDDMRSQLNQPASQSDAPNIDYSALLPLIAIRACYWSIINNRPHLGSAMPLYDRPANSISPLKTFASTLFTYYS